MRALRATSLPLWAAALAFAASLPALRNGFVWDDHWTFEQSPLLTHPSLLPRLLIEAHGYGAMGVDQGGYYRPLATLLQGLSLIAFGPRSFPLHLLSILTHSCASLFLARYLQRIHPNAAWAALIFAAFPQSADATSWISAFPDLLAATGIAAALLLFQGAMPWAGGLALLASLLGKESALGGMLFLPVLASLGRIGPRRRWIAPSIVAVGLYALLRAVTVGFARGALEPAPGVIASGWSLTGRIFLIDALRLLWPWQITLEPPPWVVDGGHASLGALGIVLLVGVLSLGLIFLKRGGGSLLLPLLALLPVLQVVRTNDVFGARFLYLPALGFAIAIGLLLTEFKAIARWPRLVPAAMTTLALAMGLRAGLRAREWSDDLTLFEAEVRRNPGSVRARVQLADVTLNRGDLARARPMVEALARELPTHPRVRAQQALLWMNEGRAAEAEPVFRELIATWHRTPTLLANLAGCELRLGRNEEGLATLDEAIRGSTPTPGMRNNRGLALQALGRLTEARAEFELALARDARYRPARVNLINLLAGALAKPEEARIEANRYLELFPNGPEAARMRELARGDS